MFVATSEARLSARLSARVFALTVGRAGGPSVIRLHDSSLSNECAMENLVKARRSDMHKSNVSTSGCLITETCCRLRLLTKISCSQNSIKEHQRRLKSCIACERLWTLSQMCTGITAYVPISNAALMMASETT